MLRIEDLRAGYSAGPVLFDVSMSVESGKFVSVLGANGAGKSSLLRAIMGINTFISGVIEFEGASLVGLPTAERSSLGIGYVPENRRLWPLLTVEDNLRLGGWASRRDASMLVEQMEFVLELFPRLKERFRHRAGVLSGGEQQMVAVGRSLMNRPRLLLVDEPSIGLSPLACATVFDALRTLQERTSMAVLLVEQKAREALDLCQTAYLLSGGAVEVSGTSDEVRNGEAVRQAYFG